MPPDTIQEIRIRGYKSLADETKIEIRPLTILAGANSSGKSSAMQPLLLLKQTLASPSDPGVLQLAGPNVLFTNYEQMLYSCPGRKKAATELKFGFSSEYEDVDSWYVLRGKDLTLERSHIRSSRRKGNPMDLTFEPGDLSEEAISRLPEMIRQLPKLIKTPAGAPLKFRALVNRGFLELSLGGDEGGGMPVGSFGPSLHGSIKQQLLNLIHIPGLRGNPQRDYPLRTTKGPRFDGFFQDYVAGLIAAWGSGEETKRLGDALKQLGLTWKVKAQPLDATRVEIVVGRLRNSQQGGARDLVNIADVGFGVSQVLPALVALEVAQPGQLVHLEQPEIHLHPKAQRRLAGALANAARRGVRLIVETHSSILIRAVQTLVAKGEFDASLVKLHWFTRDEVTGATAVSSADLDENGAFGAEWPEDFDDTYLEAEQDYLDAVEARTAP